MHDIGFALHLIFCKCLYQILLGGRKPWKLIAKRQIQATWFGDFSPQPPANVTAAGRRVRLALDAFVRPLRSPTLRAKRRALQAEAAALKQEARARESQARFASLCTSGQPCLFNVAADPTERNDLAALMPERVERMRSRLHQASRCVADSHYRSRAHAYDRRRLGRDL